MDRNRALSLVLGLLTIGMMILVGYSMTHKPPWLSAELGLMALGALSGFLLLLRSPQAAPFPRPAPSDPPATKADEIPPGTGTPLVFLLIGIGCVLAISPFALCSCSPSKQVIVPNEPVSNCISRKAQKEAQCNLDAKTAAEAETCKAKLREHRCADDGGV